MIREAGVAETPSKIKYVVGSSVAVLLLSACVLPVLYPRVSKMPGAENPDRTMHETLGGLTPEAPKPFFDTDPSTSTHSASPSAHIGVHHQPMPIVETNSSAVAGEGQPGAGTPSVEAKKFLTSRGAYGLQAL
jgi:hypothetical protein